MAHRALSGRWAFESRVGFLLLGVTAGASAMKRLLIIYFDHISAGFRFDLRDLRDQFGRGSCLGMTIAASCHTRCNRILFE